jgi:hypothetical protein
MIVELAPKTPLNEYELALAPHRQRCLERPGLRVLLDRAIAPQLLHRFLIEFCARGVQMTAPVADWIERAGDGCFKLGLHTLGDALRAHARHEAGHDQLFVADTLRLVTQYNATYQAALDVRRLLGQPPTPAIARYVELHESTIAGSAPYGQVAIELEIEQLSIEVGPLLLDQIDRVLGSSLRESLSFLVEHVALDAGHTALNRRMLLGLLSERPSALAALIETGALALTVYLDFLEECLATARNDLAQSSSQTPFVHQAMLPSSPAPMVRSDRNGEP